VLTNLINNALKFTPAGGQVHLQLGGCPEDPRFLQVTVSDTGRGIAADQQELIFKRLHQVNASEVPAASRSGLGLGLYICRELVELHGGRIWVESQPGQGSAFKFTLPKEPTSTTRSALVVDDEAIIRDTLCAFLQSESFDATAAAGGAVALELIRKRLPNVVVLDLQMPGMDGAETLRLIRREWPDVPVVISTGYPKGDLMERLAAYAPFAVLEKPYLPQALLNTIRALIH
jgi:CheY-like chemotaxis protein